MAHTKVTLCLEDTTFRRLQTFSLRSGMPQSTLVEQIVNRGLTHLERHWHPADDILAQAFADNDCGLAEVSARGKRSKRA